MSNLLHDTPILFLQGIFCLLTIVSAIKILAGKRISKGSYIYYIWILFLILIIGELWSFRAATWGYGILCFFILREYFSLVDLRAQDRLGILAAYFSIPFMMHFVHTDWYNMFIITIPVYSFLLIPFLISVSGRDSEGAIYSIGTITFGLFLFVYCIGHLAYLAFHSTWMAAMLVLNIFICDAVCLFVEKGKLKFRTKLILKYLLAVPFTVSLTFLLSEWTTIPQFHSIMIGLIIPAMVLIGNYTIQYFETDLGIDKDKMKPGRGLIIDNVKSILYAAPIVLHYIRYFIF